MFETTIVQFSKYWMFKCWLFDTVILQCSWIRNTHTSSYSWLLFFSVIIIFWPMKLFRTETMNHKPQMLSAIAFMILLMSAISNKQKANKLIEDGASSRCCQTNEENHSLNQELHSVWQLHASRVVSLSLPSACGVSAVGYYSLFTHRCTYILYCICCQSERTGGNRVGAWDVFLICRVLHLGEITAVQDNCRECDDAREWKEGSMIET